MMYITDSDENSSDETERKIRKHEYLLYICIAI